ncbi:hypothetical protein [Lysobacter sp. CA199]|uniref:hypothetical protein n=1 Tax=Lysobacter sp. CA199 TaxID=3455608 RepID=UPI003F8CF738
MQHESPGKSDASTRLPGDEAISSLMQSMTRKKDIDPAEKVLRSGMHNVLLVFGIVILGLCVHWVSDFYFLRWDARILGSELVCQEPRRNRCTHLFTAIVDGQTRTRYDVPGGFTRVDLEVGNIIHKQRLGFGYRVNGERRTFWSHMPYIVRIWLLGAALIGLWTWHRVAEILGRRKKRPMPQDATS